MTQASRLVLDMVRVLARAAVALGSRTVQLGIVSEEDARSLAVALEVEPSVRVTRPAWALTATQASARRYDARSRRAAMPATGRPSSWAK